MFLTLPCSSLALKAQFTGSRSSSNKSSIKKKGDTFHLANNLSVKLWPRERLRVENSSCVLNQYLTFPSVAFKINTGSILIISIKSHCLLQKRAASLIYIIKLKEILLYLENVLISRILTKK